ncbi:helix-turn-helix transcriptional regulator [Alkalihalobacterium alkalinitrilicum]|uniref:helix-turn-helix transcriptional regulator n=1 Tax=Alkalihalobacterium alkalinitrilicum TaxID=427920 RepID=UPI000995C3D9|nr:helix-turn-helix transcriptional regulator [Alkalihalobacterium alkalinitrilicum]
MRQWLIDKRGNLSQEFVAAESGISRGAYSNIENGKRDPSVTVAKNIGKVLGFDWTIFFEDKCFETAHYQPAASNS